MVSASPAGSAIFVQNGNLAGFMKRDLQNLKIAILYKKPLHLGSFSIIEKGFVEYRGIGKMRDSAHFN